MTDEKLKEMPKVKCERCGRIRELFQYTFFDTKQGVVEYVRDNGVLANPRMTNEKIYSNASRGLCEECAVEVNKKTYDAKK